MRHCLDCGLHRKSVNASPLIDQRRKRIFWTAYMLERSVARTVGRPYAVADREIDVAIPANIDDTLNTDEEIAAAITASEANPDQVTSLTAAIHIIQLQQLESRISKTVCRVDKPISAISPHKIAKLRLALDEWKSRIPRVQASEGGVEDKPPYSTADYHMIQYHKALLLLFLPFLPSFTPAHPEFRQVIYSAGQICQLYKRLHDNQSYISFSLLALHATFVAGLVLVYCFCLDKSLFGPTFSSDIRACSSMLYTISERWPAARKVRSAFESLVAATIENAHNDSGTRHQENRRDHGNGHLPLQIDSLLSHADSRISGSSRPNDPVWDNFESVLENYQINSETWMQDSIFLAMDAFPADDWSSAAEIW
ncbi:Transcription factor [Niveomyces insectorum RCEF 264]|uniref:Transcription factor n=1 Tax=Niveomyces insectorum RCEF 264 TaxID=1081102 RepID=A0A167MHU1_9HYPO|nr:Transcription factor [Niveomyces insectorum RCEF 264]